MFGLISGEMGSATHSASLDEASGTNAGTGLHRHRWTLFDVSRGITIRRDVCGQYFASPAAVRRA